MVDAATTFAGIRNENEFYSYHHLSEIFTGGHPCHCRTLARHRARTAHGAGGGGALQPSRTEGSHSDSAGIAWTMASDTSIATKNGALPMATSLNGRCLAMPWIT